METDDIFKRYTHKEFTLEDLHAYMYLHTYVIHTYYIHGPRYSYV